MPHVDNPASDASAHIADTSDAHDASAISVNSATLVGVGTDVQAVLEELDDAVAAAGGGGTLTGLVAFSGDITPSQITATVTNYNPTGLSTASTLRLSSNALQLITGLAGGADGRVIVLKNVGTFDLLLLNESGGSTAANRLALPAATTNLKPSESVIMQYDGTLSRWGMIAGVPDTPPSVVLDNWYVATWGSDSNDGRSWKSAMLTPAAAITVANGTGDIYFGSGTFAWADTLTLPQGVRLHGKAPVSGAAGGTEFVWTGADDGRTGLITSTNASADWTQGIIENIRFTGSGVGMSGGGTCLAIRNAQNAAKLFNVHVVTWGTGVGIDIYTTIDSGFPGYINFENVWVSGCDTGWRFDSPMTNIVLTNCASDPVATHGTTRSWLVRATGYPYGAAVNKTITSSSQSGAVATHVATAHGLSVGYFVDISGTSIAGYDGVFYVASVPDANTFTVNCGALTGLGASTGGTAFRCNNGDRATITFNSCKSESNCADAGWQFRGSTGIVMNGCSYFEQSDNAGGIAFEYRGPIHQAHGDLFPAPRIVMNDCISENMEYQFVAPFHGVSIKPDNGYTSGRFQHITYTGRANNPLTDIVGTAVPANPPSGTRRMFTDSATGEVSVRTSAGATVSLEATGGAGAPSTADYLVATANGGLSAEIVVGATPGGELGGSWASPTVDATHAGSAHHASVTIGADVEHSLSGQVISGVDASTSQKGHAKVGAVTPTTQASGDAAAVGAGDGAANASHKHGIPDLWIPVTFNMDGTLATGVGVSRWYNDSGRTLTIAKIRAAVGTAPSGASILADVNIGGTTIWSTQGNRVAIAAASNTGTQTSFNTTTIADGSYFTMDIDQVGSGTVGADLVVTIWLKG